MSNFNIEDEIDNLIDKLSEQLKIRLKKLVARSEKLVLKEYITSQKSKVQKPVVEQRGNRNIVKTRKTEHKKVTGKTKVVRKAVPPKREREYSPASSYYTTSCSESE